MKVIDYSRSYIYVAGEPSGSRHKIGVSGNPNERLGGIRKSHGASVEFQYVVYAPINVALLAEVCAHDILRSEDIGGEWFSVNCDEAVRVVNQALLTACSGWFSSSKARTLGSLASRVLPEKITRPLSRRASVTVIFEDKLPAIRSFDQRPTSPEKIEKAKELLRGGMSMRQVSIAVGLAESTLYRDIPGGTE